ncbi:MAG: hypothetical protein ACKVP0_09320 [Pirellulaceae bacterium]
MEILQGERLVNFALYNLQSDIGQRHNLAEKEPTRLAEMRHKLTKVDKQVQDLMPAWDLPSATPSTEKPNVRQ